MSRLYYLNRDYRNLERRNREAARKAHGVLEYPVASGSFSAVDFAFGCALNGTTLTVNAGTIRIHGIGNYAIEGADITLSNSTEWVYVEWDRSAPADAEITAFSSEQESTATHVYWLLAVYKETDSVFGLDTAGIKHIGDIQLDVPTM